MRCKKSAGEFANRRAQVRFVSAEVNDEITALIQRLQGRLTLAEIEQILIKQGHDQDIIDLTLAWVAVGRRNLSKRKVERHSPS
jgi:hypothetical protein